MKSMKSKALMFSCLMATGILCSGCATANVVIPDSLRAECVPTTDVRNAVTLSDLSKAIIQGDADTRICSVKKDAVIAIAEARNRSFWQFWR